MMANRARNYYHKSWRKLDACVYTLHHLRSLSHYLCLPECIVYMLLRGNSLNIQQFQLWEVMQINSLIACFLLHHCCSSPKWNTKLAISQYICSICNKLNVFLVLTSVFTAMNVDNLSRHLKYKIWQNNKLV